jgi:adenosyl cobinamide kinase/adenosyl cobinamide phosphate guanylyltransferase
MHLIFGGAYQGKLDYAKERYQLEEKDVFDCGAVEKNYSNGAKTAEPTNVPAIDFSKKAINQLEEFVLGCVHCGTEARDILEAARNQWSDTIFICTDISSGVVPFEKELRAWREMTGRTLMYLGKEADEVTRVFCGLPQKIK